MNAPLSTILQLVQHVLNQHPDLASTIRDLASQKLVEKSLEGRPAKETFRSIYLNGLWGRSSDPDRPFFSGPGSDNPRIVGEYIRAVSSFLSRLPRPPSVLDLGCGDFEVGRKLRALCSEYIACDIVPELIEHNRRRFVGANVDFRILDLIADPLPEAEIVVIRQVLQHLSNNQIISLIPKLQVRQGFLIVTEHLPSEPNFRHNLDHRNESSIRVYNRSGVVLTSPPFNLVVKSALKLCEVVEAPGVICTTLYSL